MTKLREKIRVYIPVGVQVIMLITLAAIALHITAALCPAFADFYVRYVGSYLRAALSYMTVWIPFSLAEMLLLLIPVIFVALIIYSFRISERGKVASTRFMLRILSATMVLYSIFVFGFGTGYCGTTIDKKLGLQQSEVSAEELADTAGVLGRELNTLTQQICFQPESSSVSPYSVRQTSDLICRAYDSIYDDYTFITPLWSRAKPIVLSEPMTYTHIAGVYSYFTGEANINTNFPDYTQPYTIAHELAHQRGIAREDEANFVAFLACTASEDPYIRYSGYLNVYEYVLSALYSADPELYQEVISGLDLRVRYEMNAYSDFFEKYRDSVASNVSGAINDTYLKLQGTEGSRSYGLVVDLAVAYYREKNFE